MDVPWWVWIVGGLGLTLLELMIPAFFVIWFGLAALGVGLTVLLWPALSLTAQIALWIVLSVGLVAAWFRLFRPAFHKTRVGLAGGEVLGEIGLLVGAVAPFERGRVRFQRPVLGAEEWPCLADAPIAAGQRVKVVAIEGSFLKVQPA